MLARIRRTLNPSWYQGTNGAAPYFEGWYFKLVSRDGQSRLAVIPGLFRHPESSRSHAFVQVMRAGGKTAVYARFEPGAFGWERDRFEITIGPNRFSSEGLALDLAHDGLRLSGEVLFPEIHPWPVGLLQPGIMGWYAWMPFMECYHGVVSLDHELHGALAIDGQVADFTGGRGYIEKDWGRSFPECWVWIQSNHFDREGVSLTASIAKIPWLRSHFPGFIVGLLVDGSLFRFATYTGARTDSLRVTDSHVEWTLSDRRHRLDIRAERTPSSVLHAPSVEQMAPRVAESIDAVVEVRLRDRKGRSLFEGTGRHAGLEIHGDLSPLVT